MKNSCRESGYMDFNVTRDHITLLKNLNMKTATYVTDDREYFGYFQNLPCIDSKRPFGNSGDMAAEALRTIQMAPELADTDEYSESQLSYGRYLILSLPMAYEAVMNHGAVEPCASKVDYYGGAAFSFRNKRPLEYWHDAVDEACSLPGVPANQLITLMMNAGKSDKPMDVILNLRRMLDHCDWMHRATDAMLDHAVQKYRSQLPDKQSKLTDAAIKAGLESGEYVLEWDW